MASLVEWANKKLTALLGGDAIDLATFLCSLTTPDERFALLLDLVGQKEAEKLAREFEVQESSAALAGQAYRKERTDERVSFASKKSASSNKAKASASEAPAAPSTATASIGSSGNNGASTDASSKRSKFVPLPGQGVVLLPGRKLCECQASVHALISNCGTCGRVVCEQEGAGPCVYCGTVVYTEAEREILQRNSNKSEKLRKELDKKYAGELELRRLAAEKHRDRLVEFDRTHTRRTKVIDDEADYFATQGNAWLTDREREVIKAKEDEYRERRDRARFERMLTIDLSGKTVVVRQEETVAPDVHEVGRQLEEQLEEEARERKRRAEKWAQEEGTASCGVRTDCDAPDNLRFPPPTYVAGKSTVAGAGGGSKGQASSAVSLQRVQDSGLSEMGDGGACMSMHQPWASLLVLGIKRHEGRSWYTGHRGRLWIAAAAKVPDAETTAAVEEQYRALYEARGEAPPDFPRDYPLACVLGCVDMVDCLSAEEYTAQVPAPAQESESPFVFLCRRARSLPFPLPVKGDHKIWKLDRAIHDAARRALLPL